MSAHARSGADPAMVAGAVEAVRELFTQSAAARAAA
jgi:hypothetical protein